MTTTLATLWLCLTGTPAAAATNVDFETQVMPVFSVAGCNAAACHGAATGQAGFRLSLFGGDTEADYRALVHQREGRRINLHRPGESLLLLKATAQLDHGGGQPLESDSAGARALREWIEQGAEPGQPKLLERLEIEPATITVAAPARVGRLAVTACFADGTRRDVSQWATYGTSDDAALTLQDDGSYSLSHSGRYWIFVRYLSLVEAISVTAPRTAQPSGIGELKRCNWIDDAVNTTLAELRIAPAPPSDDATFLRRIHLDLTGRLPSPEQVTLFLSDQSLDKRQALIDRLLSSDEATEYWTYRLAQLLRFQIPGGDVAAGETFYRWLYEQVEADRGWNRIAHDLMLAQGDSQQVGPASFHRFVNDARQQAEYFSEVMLGVRLRCANCHNHPLDRWTQDDYHGLAQIFAPLARGRIVARDERAHVIHPRTQRPATACIPGEPPDDVAPASIETLTDWLLDEHNPYFAQAMAGRIWRLLMGHGIIDPVDDTRPTNPPCDSNLLARLTHEFVTHDFRLRHLIREICSSAAYQRSSVTAVPDALALRYFACAHRRRLSAEVLADAMADVTGLDSPGSDARRTISTIALQPETVDALRVLGRCDRSTGCLSEVDETARSAAAHLQLLNGPLLNQRIAADRGRLADDLSQGLSDEALVEALYLRALSRSPTDAERTAWTQEMAAASDEADHRERIEDLLWSILNCQEFVTNH